MDIRLIDNDNLSNPYKKSKKNYEIDMNGTNFNPYNKSLISIPNKYMNDGEKDDDFEIKTNTFEDLLYLNNFFGEKDIFKNILPPNNMFETCIKNTEQTIFCFKPTLYNIINDVLGQIEENPLLMKNYCLVDIGQDSFNGRVYLYKDSLDRLIIFLIDLTMNYHII